MLPFSSPGKMRAALERFRAKVKHEKRFFFTTRISQPSGIQVIYSRLTGKLYDSLGLFTPLASLRQCWLQGMDEERFLVKGIVYGKTFARRLLLTLQIERRAVYGANTYELLVKRHPDGLGMDLALKVYPNLGHYMSNVLLLIMGAMWLPMSLFAAFFLAPVYVGWVLLLFLAGKKELARRMGFVGAVVVGGPLYLLWKAPPVAANPKELEMLRETLENYPGMVEFYEVLEQSPGFSAMSERLLPRSAAA